MLCELEQEVLSYIAAHELIPAEAKVLLAVSGGADSIALLHCLYSLAVKEKLKAHLLCAHLNHQLRAAESDEDEKFVNAQARSLGLDVFTQKLNVREFAEDNKLSIETAARQLRIEALIQIAKQNNCKFIATGHQKNDNAETVMQRLLRGTGYRGLCGIRPCNNFEDVTFIRPLLDVTRQQIVAYLEKRRLKWRLDATNQQCIYHRNFIRHRLIPEIQKDCSGSIIKHLAKLAAGAHKFHKCISERTRKISPAVITITPKKVELDINGLLTETEPVQIELIRQGLSTIGCGERDIVQWHYKQLLQLCRQQVGNKIIELPNGFRAYRQYKNLVFTQPQQPRQQKPPEKPVELKVPGKTQFAGYIIEATVMNFDSAGFEKFKADKNSFIEWFDFDKLSGPLTIRPRRQGDRFIPLGRNAEKKAGKFLTDAKIPKNHRQNVLVITDAEKIVWLCPVRIANAAGITEKTKTVLQLMLCDL